MSNYLKQVEAIQRIEGVIGDLEMRLLALEGDEIVIELMKTETKIERSEILKNHIFNLNNSLIVMRKQMETSLNLPAK